MDGGVSAARLLAAGCALALGLGCNDDGAPERAAPGRASEVAHGEAAPLARIDVHGDRFSVVARDAELGALLDRLAELAGLEIAVADDAPAWRAQRVSVERERVFLADALHAILADVPHHLHYEWEAGAAPDGPPWPPAPTRLARVTLGSLYRPPPWRVVDRRGLGASPRAAQGQPEAAAPRLDDRDPAVRARAVARLDPSGAELDALADALRDDPAAMVRRTAARALSGGRGLHTSPILLEALDDPDPEVVVAVIEALEDAYDDHPVPEIRERVAEFELDRDARIRAAARDFVEWVEE